MRPDRRIADPETGRDFTVSHPGAHQLQHLSLARAQAAAHVLAIPAPADEPGDHRRRDETATLGHLANGCNYLRSRARLLEVGAGACLDGGELRVLTRIAAQKHEPDLRKTPPHRERRVPPGAVVEVEIHHDNIWRQMPGQFRRLGDRGGFAHHFHVRLAVEQHAEALRDKLVVFDDDHPDAPLAAAVAGKLRRQPPKFDLAHRRLRTARPAWRGTGPRAALPTRPPEDAPRRGPGAVALGTCPASRKSLPGC